jgi:monomeric isocitrate dehydrogenase
MLGDTLMNAVGKWLENNRSPGRKVKQIDNRYNIVFIFKSLLIAG